MRDNCRKRSGIGIGALRDGGWGRRLWYAVEIRLDLGMLSLSSVL